MLKLPAFYEVIDGCGANNPATSGMMTFAQPVCEVEHSFAKFTASPPDISPMAWHNFHIPETLRNASPAANSGMTDGAGIVQNRTDNRSPAASVENRSGKEVQAELNMSVVANS